MRHRLELAIEFAGTTRLALAEYLGISRATIDNYIAGRTEPRISVLRDWANATGVSVSWLLDGTNATGEVTGRKHEVMGQQMLVLA